MRSAPRPLENLSHEQVIERFLGGYAVADIVAQTGWPAADVEAHLEKRIRRGPPWQPIETAPKAGKRIIAWDPDYWPDGSGTSGEARHIGLSDRWQLMRFPEGAFNPTLWMPLQEPPAQAENETKG